MIRMTFGTQVFGLKMKRDAKKELLEQVEQLVLNSMVKFAEAAAAETPLYTGYSRAIWGGVMNRLFDLGANIDGDLDLGCSKPWYLPFWPVPNPSSTVAEDPYEQQSRGIQHGYGAVSVYTLRNNVFATIEIPEPDERGGANYNINEPQWQTLVRGKMAFDEYYEAHSDLPDFEIFDL